MDPTKPILALTSDHKYNHYIYKQNEQKNKQQKINYEQRCFQLEQQKDYFKQQYQKLYKLYNEKQVKFRQYEELIIYTKKLEAKIQNLQKNPKYNQQIIILKQKNQHLSTTILNKNYQLQQMYKKIQQFQQYIKKNNINIDSFKSISTNLNKLEDGLKQAIHSNFQLLRSNYQFIPDNTINQIRNFVRVKKSSILTQSKETRIRTQ